MSIALMTLAWKANLASGQKMVLLALCDNANDQGECYPSVSMLAQKCSMTERSVQRHLNEMEEGGIVSRELRTGRSTVYHINPRKFDTPDKLSPPTQSHHTPDTVSPPPPTQCHPTPDIVSPITIKEPSIEPSEEPPKKQRAKKPRTALGMDALIAMGVDKQVAEDWLAIRKGKGLPLTKTALDAMEAEVVRAGMTMDGAIRICCVRGWARFNQAWLEPQQQGRSAPQQPQYQSQNDKAREWASRFTGGSRNEQSSEPYTIDLNAPPRVG